MYSIAIDGPAGSGKSTIAKALANKLKIEYIDTGAMFRAITLKLMENKDKSIPIEEILKNTTIAFQEGNIYLDGEDVSQKIRQEEVSNLTSDYSQIPEIRQKLLSLQQEMAKTKNVVMEGRDIGTVVLPEAKYKFFLTACAKTRAKRRQLQLQEKGMDVSFNQILADIKNRDSNDSKRKIAPLKQAEDAIRIDNSHLDHEQTLHKILSYIKEG
ncbi:MAG: (d)CMP kinase [Tissierellia bacterium]|nr:(d)CMP kinase [Tissierellia bacterium]